VNNAQPDYIQILARADEVIRWVPDPEPQPLADIPANPLRVGVDLGTAYLVLVVLDQFMQPLAGEYQFAEVVRDGLVVDYLGAIDLLTEMKKRVEARLGVELTHAASGYPPGVPQVEVRAMSNVVEAVGLRCTNMIDEPSAANSVLNLTDGAIVDVGGGTTGIAILQDGKVLYTADEATGGTHFSLVIAGAQDITFEAAEQMKVIPEEQNRLFTIVRPVMEKVGDIVSRPVFVTPVGIAMNDMPADE
jgi:ethanolamine utilization protein EutJ